MRAVHEGRRPPAEVRKRASERTAGAFGRIAVVEMDAVHQQFAYVSMGATLLLLCPIARPHSRQMGPVQDEPTSFTVQLIDFDTQI